MRRFHALLLLTPLLLTGCQSNPVAEALRIQQELTEAVQNLGKQATETKENVEQKIQEVQDAAEAVSNAAESISEAVDSIQTLTGGQE